jgi:hypothetical protein
MNIGQLSLFIFLLRPQSYSTDSWPANNVYALNGDYFEVKENASSRMLIYKSSALLYLVKSLSVDASFVSYSLFKA